MENIKEKEKWEKLGIDGRTLLKCILNKWGCDYADWICVTLNMDQMAGCFEQGNEQPVFIKCVKIVD